MTFGSKLPVEHPALLIQYGTTLTVVEKDAEPPDLTREEYWRDVFTAERAAGRYRRWEAPRTPHHDRASDFR